MKFETYFSDMREVVAQISVFLKNTLTNSSFKLTFLHAHTEWEKESADSVLLDQPDINGLSYSSPFCQAAEDGEPQKSFQQQSETIPSHPLSEQEHQINTYARTQTEYTQKQWLSVKSPILLHTHTHTVTNTHSSGAEEDLFLSSHVKMHTTAHSQEYRNTKHWRKCTSSERKQISGYRQVSKISSATSSIQGFRIEKKPCCYWWLLLSQK